MKRTLIQFIIISTLTVGAAGIGLQATIVDEPEPIDDVLPVGDYSGYIPDGYITQTITGTVQSVMLLDHKPKSLGLHLTMAVFWPTGCGTVMGMVDDPTDSEANCKQACNDICEGATGYGVLQDIAPSDHVRPHGSHADCKVCEWDCYTGGGSCYIQSCSTKDIGI